MRKQAEQLASEATVLYSIVSSRQINKDGIRNLFSRIAVLDVLNHASDLFYS